MDKLLEELKEACTPYCYCRQPFHGDRAMLACDRCNEWYHYECIGLRSDSQDASEEAALGDYLCPSCTLRAGLPFVVEAHLPEATRRALESVKAEAAAGGQRTTGPGQATADRLPVRDTSCPDCVARCLAGPFPEPAHGQSVQSRP